jgi:SAM-dependent methyltransferase
VVVSSSQESLLPFSPARASSPELVWHELECGSYRADLPLWRELAEEYRGAILDVGSGAGRVALDLARAGHRVTALDLDHDLLCVLSERDADMNVETVCGDARSFELSRHDFGLCVVPMQTVQLLGGSAGRIAFLRRARAHLRPGGLLACAIVTTLEPFDCAEGDVGPSAEIAHVDGLLYVSRAVRVCALRRGFLIERERRILPPGKPGSSGVSTAPAVETAAVRSVIELDRMSASQLECEALQAGLRPQPKREVAPTDDHVGSAVVMLHA